MKTLITITVGISVLALLFAIVPFTISIPSVIMNFFTGESVHGFLTNLYYFLPINYLVSCILICYVVRYCKVFVKLLTWIYKKIFV